MTLSHTVENGVLAVTVHDEPGIAGRATLAADIAALVYVYRPASVVIILDESAAGDSTVSAVLRAQRTCRRLDVLMSVATHSAPARRMLEAKAASSGTRLVVHARIDTAIAAACATTV
ncbi:hypothetical protein ABZ137_34425 [Streptomyces bobili]|uniref:hypothetical protein n=1 Tax=Streptomyces bobili TaxID=67280 RepID=UPI0033A039D3